MQEKLFHEIEGVRKELLQHQLYTSIQKIEDIQTFMRSHVYAVWDFMSLLKSLQRQLTCVSSPWLPTGDANLRYLINEIVLAEETDVDAKGERMSHYEMYLRAMKAAGIETAAIEKQIINIAQAPAVLDAIPAASLPPHVEQFLQTTFSIIESGETHKVAAAFTYGREDLIPDMFTEIIEGLNTANLEIDLEKTQYYFDRHIELDGDEHGPMAHKMVALLCGDDTQKWEEATQAAKDCLKSRQLLFDGILLEITAGQPTV